MTAKYFKSAADFRRWLDVHHAKTSEMILGFYKKSSGRGGLTYPEAVDELLSFGWIDGVKRRVDDERYTHRITPRRPGSTWSLVNVTHVARLQREGRMRPAGLRAFAARLAHRTGVYAYEQSVPKPRPEKFPDPVARIFRARREAWKFWQAQPPGYRRTAIFWVTSAKQPATRSRRLERLIALSAAGRRLT